MCGPLLRTDEQSQCKVNKKKNYTSKIKYETFSNTFRTLHKNSLFKNMKDDVSLNSLKSGYTF